MKKGTKKVVNEQKKKDTERKKGETIRGGEEGKKKEGFTIKFGQKIHKDMSEVIIFQQMLFGGGPLCYCIVFFFWGWKDTI